MRRWRVLRETPYFFSMARREGFEGLCSSFRASAILVSNGESIAIILSLLLRVESCEYEGEQAQIMGRYTGRGVTRGGDLGVSNN